MANYIRERLADGGPEDEDDYDHDYDAPARRADEKRCLLAALYLLADESTRLQGVTIEDWNRLVGNNNDGILPDEFYYIGLAIIQHAFREIDRAWSYARRNAPNSNTNSKTNDQRRVCDLYGNRCVLTGRDHAQGAHIVPVRALAKTMTSIWQWLRVLWPLERIQTFETEESRNILPLGIEAHWMWDRHDFALRPIQDPSRPDQLYLQLEWIGEMNTETGLVSTQRDERRGTLVMYDRGDATSCPKIANGSVFRFTTADPGIAPLPDFRLMQAQYAIHRLCGSVRTAGALSIIFSGNPPDCSEDDDLSFDARMARIDPVWDDMIRTAMDCRVLDEAEAGRWADAFFYEFSCDRDMDI